MKLSIFRRLLFIVIPLTFMAASCGPPPPDWETVDALDYTADTMAILNRFSGDVVGFREYFTENRDANTVFAFLRNSNVRIRSGYGPVYPGVVLRSLPGNDLIVERGLYVSEGRKNEALVSLDDEVWVSTRTDFDRGIDNFVNQYHYDIDYRPAERILEIDYVLSSGFNDEQREVRVPKRRELETLKKGMIFKHPNKDLVNYDLTKRKVYIPEGTIVSADFRFAGNLLNSGEKGNEIIVDVLRDVYMYYNKPRVGISFDGEDWSPSIFAFTIAPLLQVYADADDHISVIFGLYAQYEP